MCPPDHFKVEYSINPWMRDDPVDNKKAMSSWLFLKQFVSDLGEEVKTIKGHEGLPDMVFTANAGIVHNGQVVLSNFKHPERQGERAHFKKWFKDNNYVVHELPSDIVFEGRGDCFVFRDYLIGGYGFRTEKKAIKMTADILGLKPMAIHLKNKKFYHLDTCFSIISEQKGLAIYYPAAFEKSFEEEMSKIDINLLPVNKKEAKKFACNAITIDRSIVMPSGCHKIETELLRHGFVVADIAMDEFLKSGGACRCLVLEI
jgi:N-dimethylarginine dimethylaminohydrolase